VLLEDLFEQAHAAVGIADFFEFVSLAVFVGGVDFAVAVAGDIDV